LSEQISTYTSSDCRHDTRFVAQDNGIGDLFRDYGERYIKVYKPPLIQIKLIRSIRVCKTPALGGKVYICKGCGDKKYVYYSCGNSRCPKCQGIKRIQWQDKLATKMLKCPYQHITFTMPKSINNVARHNPTAIYNMLMRSAWHTIKKGSMQPEHLGAQPGAIMVLHTFGSDLKYHVHVHMLVTFGGIDKHGQWRWPKRKRKIIPYREMRRTYRRIFIKALKKQYEYLETTIPWSEFESILKKKSWCVNAQPPTSETKVIQEYLGRYICRIGLSKKKFHYDQSNQEVTIEFKDYRNRDKSTSAVPKSSMTLSPLLAINRILQHTLPAYFQKCRYTGLHASATAKKYKDSIPTRIKNNSTTVRTVFQIINGMLGIDEVSCDYCGHTIFEEELIRPQRDWIYTYIDLRNRGSPKGVSHNITTHQSGDIPHSSLGSPCPKGREIAKYGPLGRFN